MKKKEISSELTSKGSAEDTLLLQPNANHNASAMEREATGEIILYQPDETIKLEVKLERETVWLTQQQMADLFGKERSGITKHISNIFNEGELEEESNVSFFHIANSDKPVKFFSLDVLISVGYRVKSFRGTKFRQWANRILREHLLNGVTMDSAFRSIQMQIDTRFDEQAIKIYELENRQRAQQEEIDFLVKTHSTPEEQLFPNGCVWDAYSYVSSLIRSAKEQVILIDNYVDETVLTLLDKRADGVKAVIHSRFLIIDSQVYLLGNSLKDMGHTLSAAILTGFTVDEVLGKLK